MDIYKKWKKKREKIKVSACAEKNSKENTNKWLWKKIRDQDAKLAWPTPSFVHGKAVDIEDFRSGFWLNWFIQTTRIKR